MKTYHRDFRGLDEATQAEVRRQAFRNLDKGYDRRAVADLAQVHVKTVGDWVRRRSELARRDYRGKRRGRAPYEQRTLSRAQEADIKRAIERMTPDAIGVPYALWTRKAIAQLVKRRTRKVLTLRTVSKYTKRWGLTPQRPAKVAREQDPAALKRWKEETFPAIVKRARAENAEIHWEDETGISLATFYARSYAPKGKTPAIKLSAKRASLSMISAIANRGDLRFMLYHGALDADLFLVFLKRLVKDTRRKIFLICDNLQVHKARKLDQWVAAHHHMLELFFPARVQSAGEPR